MWLCQNLIYNKIVLKSFIFFFKMTDSDNNAELLQLKNLSLMLLKHNGLFEGLPQQDSSEEVVRLIRQVLLEGYPMCSTERCSSR